MKKEYFLLIIAGVIILAAVILRLTGGEDNWVCQKGQWVKHGHPRNPQPTALCPGVEDSGQLVGHDRDSHGCIGSAGYAWCEIKQKCLRNWEEPCAIVSSIEANAVVEVFLPKPETLVKSPLVVVGQARGNWFFEASLPVKLVDANNNLLASGPGEAKSDWMTEDMVPFVVTFSFNTTTTTTDMGYLVISKDNPSGLPENDASIRVPVKFK